MRAEIMALLTEVVSLERPKEPYDPYRTVGARYAPLDGPFERLEAFATENDPAVIAAILSDPSVLQLLPQVYAVRALFEHELEWRLASETIAAPDAAQRIAKQVDDKIAALPAAFFEAIADCRNILFAGCGPFPTTAMALYRRFGWPVVCIDRDPRANQLARDYITASNFPYRMAFVDADLADFQRLGEFDCVVCAFLIGVGTSLLPPDAKSLFIRDVAGKLPPGVPLVLRSPQGLGRLVYPALDPDHFEKFRYAEFPDKTHGPVCYDKTFTVVEKTGQLT